MDERISLGLRWATIAAEALLAGDEPARKVAVEEARRLFIEANVTDVCLIDNAASCQEAA